MEHKVSVTSRGGRKYDVAVVDNEIMVGTSARLSQGAIQRIIEDAAAPAKLKELRTVCTVQNDGNMYVVVWFQYKKKKISKLIEALKESPED